MIGPIAAALLAPAAAAQPALPVEAVSAEHAPARLDGLLAARDYKTLGRTIGDVATRADVESDLNWLKARMMEGNSVFVTMLYSRLLWAATQNLADEPKSQVRQTAAMATLYAYAATIIDGKRCGDATAPSHRLEQLMTWNPEVFPFLASLSPEQRKVLADVAVRVESHTASRRDRIGDVEFLCRAGMEETQYNLQHGSAREVPTSPGSFGRTIELSGDGKYRPSERPESEWRADAARLRASLPTDLSGFVEGIARAAGEPRPR
jgi:hypothetical protein